MSKGLVMTLDFGDLVIEKVEYRSTGDPQQITVRLDPRNMRVGVWTSLHREPEDTEALDAGYVRPMRSRALLQWSRWGK